MQSDVRQSASDFERSKQAIIYTGFTLALHFPGVAVLRRLVNVPLRGLATQHRQPRQLARIRGSLSCQTE